jgi:CRISPR-associated protein Cas1
MQLVLISRGAALRVRDGCFSVRPGKTGEAEPEERLFAARKIDSILIGASVSVTSDALSLAIEHNIDVLLLNRFGEPEGRVWHCRFGSTAAIRRRQLEAEGSGLAEQIARAWIAEKVSRQAGFLERLLHARPGREDGGSVAALQVLAERAGQASRDDLLGIEAQSARLYFALLAELIPPAWRFEGRSRNPALDPFNCYLNYAYGVLYGRVEKACILAGLDPYVGFLHVDGHGRKALVFDLIEPFRHLATYGWRTRKIAFAVEWTRCCSWKTGRRRRWTTSSRNGRGGSTSTR